MARIQDAPEAQYIVTVIHDEYEQTVLFFVGEEAARLHYDQQKESRNEVYISKILA
jgi:hypothetical protein